MQLKSVKLFIEFWKVADELCNELEELFFFTKKTYGKEFKYRDITVKEL